MWKTLVPFVVVAVGVVVLAGCTAGAPTPSGSARASATASARPAIPARLAVAAHLAAQEGLAIALASNVLQTQLLLVSDASNDAPVSSCTALPGGGAHQVSGWGGSSGNRTLTESVFYDTACAQPYLVAQASVGSSGDSASAHATVAYTSTGSAPLGTLTTDAVAAFTDNIQLEGTGTFSRPGAPTVSLGLACKGQSSTVLNCQGGVAQDFAALGQSIGSITPLQLTVGTDVSNPISFTGTANTTAIAPLGALSVVSPDKSTLALQGATPVAGDAATSGQAGGFVLFPPTPTGWTITDPAGDVAFTITVTDNTSRALTGSVTQVSTKKILGAIAVDRSGTGTITWLGQKAAPITSWMLTR